MKIDLVSEKMLLSSIAAASVAFSTPLAVLEPINKIVIDDVENDPNKSSSYNNIHKGFKIYSIQQKLLDYNLVAIKDNNQNQQRTHSTIRPFQKLKSIPVNGADGQESLAALFINSKGAEIKVADYVLIHVKEGLLYSLGDNGTAVKEIQNFLIEAGYYHFEKDGIFGENTKKAVLSYQKDNGLVIDGIVGQQTYEHIAGITGNAKIDLKNIQSSPTSIPSVKEGLDSIPEPIIKSSLQKAEKNDLNLVDLLQNGDSGQAVKDLQRLLNNKGYYPNRIDGVFGSITEAAVRTYQLENKLTADGIAGSMTIKHLKITPSKPLTSRSTYPPAVAEKIDDGITINEVINYGKKLIGTPYIWGGTTPNGFDCSGFLMYVFKRNGVSIPRTVSEIWNSSTSVQNPEPGDIVFFETYKKGPSHAGIYIGNQEFLNAGSSTGVTISNLNNNYWSSRYLGAKRIN